MQAFSNINSSFNYQLLNQAGSFWNKRVQPKLQVLLGLDVWEHSYYLDFQNKRPDYVTNFLDKLAHYEFADAQLKSA